MYYFVDMYNDKLNFLENISDEDCYKALQASERTQEIVEFYYLGLCVRDALEQLIEWNNCTMDCGNNILRNLHMAERLARGFLFEFRTCLDHMETAIKQTYGESSDLLKIFKTSTGKAYDSIPEYAFTSHLRNCSQHCKNIVHGFNGTTGSKMSSNVTKLLREYKRWNAVDKNYMSSVGNDIDLMTLFSRAFEGMNIGLKPVMQYLLEHDGVCESLLYLRKWGDELSKATTHDVNSFHIMKPVFADGSDATKEEMAAVGVTVHAYPIDWDMVYALTDSLSKRDNS